MQSSWTPARDKRLQALEQDGLSAAQIAKKLGTSRNAVIGRSRRLRGIVYQSDIDSWTRANARRSEEAHARMAVRAEKQKKVIADMARAIAGGTAKPTAMLRAFKAGAFWRQIGEHFGISQQAAYEAAKKARKRGAGAVARGHGRRPRSQWRGADRASERAIERLSSPRKRGPIVPQTRTSGIWIPPSSSQTERRRSAAPNYCSGIGPRQGGRDIQEHP